VENYTMQNGMALSQKIWFDTSCVSLPKISLLFLNTSDVLHGIYFSAKLIMQLPISPCHH